jgi:hypothetical protein
MLHDDLFHPLADITHRLNLCFELGSINDPGIMRRERAGQDGVNRRGLGRNIALAHPVFPPSFARLTYFIGLGQPKESQRKASLLPTSPAEHQIIAMPPLTCKVCPVT